MNDHLCFLGHCVKISHNKNSNNNHKGKSMVARVLTLLKDQWCEFQPCPSSTSTSAPADHIPGIYLGWMSTVASSVSLFGNGETRQQRIVLIIKQRGGPLFLAHPETTAPSSSSSSGHDQYVLRVKRAFVGKALGPMSLSLPLFQAHCEAFYRDDGNSQSMPKVHIATRLCKDPECAHAHHTMQVIYAKE